MSHHNYNKPLLVEHVEFGKAEAVDDASTAASRTEFEEMKEKVRLLVERDAELALALAENERLPKKSRRWRRPSKTAGPASKE